MIAREQVGRVERSGNSVVLVDVMSVICVCVCHSSEFASVDPFVGQPPKKELDTNTSQ